MFKAKFIFPIVILLVAVLISNKLGFFDNFKNFLAATFFVKSIEIGELKEKYKEAEQGRNKIKIAIVPGHDENSPGTEFNGIQEKDLTVLLGKDLANFLGADKNFDVTLIRNEKGYNENFLNYFENARGSIENFVKSQKQEMTALIEAGAIDKVSGVFHNKAASDTAVKLYGINKWLSDNAFDIVIHIHFNDYPRRKPNTAGKYSGFSIYIPEKQFSNSEASKAIAESIFPKLELLLPKSNLPEENKGVVEDQTLIAIGAYNSLDAAGLLIEYGYIYEPPLQSEIIRNKFINELAFQTYEGIKSFFVGENYALKRSVPLTENLNVVLKTGEKNSAEVLSLQLALSYSGFYPPYGYSQRDCPFTGNFKKCTQLAVKEFQKKYGIVGEENYAGETTIQKLKNLYPQ